MASINWYTIVMKNKYQQITSWNLSFPLFTSTVTLGKLCKYTDPHLCNFHNANDKFHRIRFCRHQRTYMDVNQPVDRLVHSRLK